MNHRLPILVWMFLLVAAALGLYGVKYKVQDVKDEVAALSQKLREEKEALHVLQAEWAYLNRPARLQALAGKHAGLIPLQSGQVAEVNMLPMPVQPDSAIIPASLKEGTGPDVR